MSIPIEIERKYVIAIPDESALSRQENYTVSEIRQTYLESAAGVTRRVRMRIYSDRVEYTETKKVRIDATSAYEDEREIDEREYLSLLKQMRRGTRTLIKKRHAFFLGTQSFEIDIYPEWERSCILETELPTRDTEAHIPDFIRVIEDVTGVKKYTNASMAHEFPIELI